MLIPRFKDIKLPNYDLKAGRQIFDKEHDRSDKYVALVSKDAQNPIDIRLRQMAIESLDGTIDLKREFLEKWVVAVMGDINNLHFVKGRIKDMFIPTRDLRIKTRRGDDVIVPFDKVMEYTDREP